MIKDMDQFTSSPNKENVNEFINFLLSATRSNSKIIRARVNYELYDMLLYACTQLDESVSEFIKKAIIERLARLNLLKVKNQYISEKDVSYAFNGKKNHRNNNKRLLAKVRENCKKEKLEEIKKEYYEIKNSFNRISGKLSNKYNDFSTLKETSIIYERINVLLKLLEDFLKKYDIDDDEYNELDKIIDDLTDIRDTLRSYYKFNK